MYTQPSSLSCNMSNQHSSDPCDAISVARECLLQVALEQGYSFDDDEISAMMEAAATITERASTTSMTFQGFEKLVAHYSRTMPQ